MRTKVALLACVAGFMAGACGSDAASSPSAPVTGTDLSTTAEPATTVAEPGDHLDDALFADDFVDDANGWGIVDDPQYGSTSYSNGDYVWVFKGSVAHWLPATIDDRFLAGSLSLADVVVHVEATIQRGDGVIGVFCRDNPDTDAEVQWYEFVVRDGYAAIRLADLEGNIEPLVEHRDVTLPLGRAFTIEATCADDASGGVLLAMFLNGEEIMTTTVTDHPLEDGVVGLQAWTHPAHAQMDILWHDFAVKRVGAA